MSTIRPVDTTYTYYDSRRGDGYTTTKIETETIDGVTYKYIYDTRSNADPNIKILDSVNINECYQLDLIEIIQDYNTKNPVKNKDGIAWDRFTSDLLSEWNVHNIAFTHPFLASIAKQTSMDSVISSSQSVDFNNADEGKYIW